MVHSWYCGSQHACDRQHRENMSTSLISPFRYEQWRASSVRINPSKSRSRSLLLYHSLPFKGVVRCGLAGDQRWTDSHLAAAPRGTAAPTRFGASSVVAYRHRSPPSLSRSLVIAPSFTFSLSFFFPLPSPSSLSSSACTPASRRARLDPTPLHHSALSPLPSSHIVLPRSPTLSVSCSPLRLFTFPLPLLSSSPSSSFSLSLQLALVLVTYTFSPPTTTSTTTPFSSSPSALHPTLCLAFNPRRPTSAHRGVAWYTMRYDLPALFPLSFSHPLLRTLPLDSSLTGVPLPPAAIVHPGIAREERIVTMARSI